MQEKAHEVKTQRQRDDLHILPFMRKPHKIYEVRISLIVDFQIRVRSNIKDPIQELGIVASPQDQVRYAMMFKSHYNQAYWDSVGAYATTELRNIIWLRLNLIS